MLRLPSIALLTIDVARPHAALESLYYTLNLARFHSVHLLTDLARWTDLAPRARSLGVFLHNHVESNETTTFPGIERKFFVDYEKAVLTEPHTLLTSLPPSVTHCLHKEWDSGVANPNAWTDDFLAYDFIGAPWPPHNNPGWPACDGATNAVGNTGFSLQSRRFAAAASAAFLSSDDSTRFTSDRWICRTQRRSLEAAGVRFAPVDIAACFSCEDRIYAGSFGWHGKGTVQLNGWGHWMKMFTDKR